MYPKLRIPAIKPTQRQKPRKMEYAEDSGDISKFEPPNTWPFSGSQKQREN